MILTKASLQREEPVGSPVSHTFSLAEAANGAGVTQITLKRWLLAGRFPEINPDGNGSRVFTEENIRRMKAFAGSGAPNEPAQLSLFQEDATSVYVDKSASFRDSAFNGNRKLPFHRWVPWIAGFSSNFVEDCFSNYINPAVPPPEITVLDPFAGVGTTLIEGVMHGYSVVGFEINPYAHLACKVKLSASDLNAGLVEEELRRFLHYYSGRACDADYTPRTRPPEKFGTRAAFFSPEVERKALIVVDYVSSIENLKIRDLFRLAFGAVMVSFSNYSYEPSLGRRESSGKENILDAPVERILAAKVREMSSDIRQFGELCRDASGVNEALVFNESFFRALDFCEEGSVDLLVTSPPYLNNYHYLRNTRPQLFWLGMASDPKQLRPIEHESFGKFWQTVRDEETIRLEFRHAPLEQQLQVLRGINSQRKTYGGHGWANYAATYFNDSYRFCKLVGRLLKPGGIAVVVIGNSILQGLEIRTDEIFSDIAGLAGLEKKDIILLRRKRTGSSIVDSSVRAGKTPKTIQLYETAVVLMRCPSSSRAPA